MSHNFQESRDLDNDDKVEPQELLEDCWFFCNLLDRKPRMMRSYSDPYSSSATNFNQDTNLSYEETYESIKKLSIKDQTPPKASHLQRSKSSRRSSSSSSTLVRAPSLPTTLENQNQNQDEEIEFSMGKLIRQASLNYSHTLPPRKDAHKGVITNSSPLTQKLRKQESINRSPVSQLRTQRSLKELESEELQGFKDLGFDLSKKELSPEVVRIIPGLQEKEKADENRPARPYLSEAWAAHSSAPPVPRWGGKRSTVRSTEDMKAQIKFWARAVASNVRQEC